MSNISKFSIQSIFAQNEEEKNNIETQNLDDLPNDHFTETDLQKEWETFLKNLKNKDIVVYNAISGFQLHKIDEDIIQINYPSDSAKYEFEKVNSDFFNAFKKKVNHYRLDIQYKMDHENLKKEIITKKKIFEKYAEINPILRDLDALLQFNLND